MQNETMLEANGGVRSKQSEGLWVSKELEQLFVVVARYMAYQLVGGSLGHGLVGALAGVEVVAVGIVDLGEGDGLGAGEVRKTETQLAAVERHADGVWQREVRGIDGLTAIGDAGGISPTSHPLHVIAHTLIDN